MKSFCDKIYQFSSCLFLELCLEVSFSERRLEIDFPRRSLDIWIFANAWKKYVYKKAQTLVTFWNWNQYLVRVLYVFRLERIIILKIISSVSAVKRDNTDFIWKGLWFSILLNRYIYKNDKLPLFWEENIQ